MTRATELTLQRVVEALAQSLKHADATEPVATGRGGRTWRPGIGPHSESETFSLLVKHLACVDADLAGLVESEIGYPAAPRQRCDIVIRDAGGEIEWAIEAKLLRFLGDNGKPNDNMLMHVISPYEHDRSALTDCTKLRYGGLGRRHAILILGYECADRSLEPAIAAFELLASARCELGPRITATAAQLVHPVHHTAMLFAWEIRG